ncbi:MAG: hypothetical protein ABS59_04590 [Methylobacterium sp. SCN 67-24]|nr:MAG: hypothetical protein ABS59_04590 [Methylobacterium sp. SCN 67-24]
MQIQAHPTKTPLPFVLAKSKPYALEQYEDGELGYYDSETQTWRGTVLFHKSSTSRNVSSTSGRTSDSDLASDVLGN